MTLNFKISNQILKQIGETKPANLSQEYLELDIDFKTTDWTGLTKFGLFTNQNGLKYRVALTDDKVIVPNSCLADEKFKFSIYGVLDDVRITTNQLTIYLKDSGYVRDVENDIPDDDPTIVEQIYEALDTKANTSDMTTALAGKSDVGHSHTKSDITDFPTNVSAFNNDAGYLTEHQSLEDYYNKSETDTLLDFKSNTGHTHTKSDITDFTHTHAKSDITDFAHNHDDRYYTESEVDAIIDEVKQELNNRVILKGDKPIIQTGDTTDFTAYAVKDGMPVVNEKIYFFKED